jgi:deoxyribose-phosphate aldolase
VVAAMVEAGADRIGTSAGPAIMEQYLKQNK